MNCDTRVFDTHDGGYSVDGDRVFPDCPNEHDFFEVNVSADGLVSDGVQLNTDGGRSTSCAGQL